LLEKYASEIGIIPITSKQIVYNASKDLYLPIDEIDKTIKLGSRSGDAYGTVITLPDTYLGYKFKAYDYNNVDYIEFEVITSSIASALNFIDINIFNGAV
jgi:hypothetical protein